MTKEVDVQVYIAISEVKARYCRTLDTKDWAGFADVFTEDFDSDGTAAGGWHIKGRDAVVSAIRASIEHAQTAHQVHSPEMKIDGDVADVVWAMQDRVIWEPEHRPRPDMGGLTGFGHYHERYVRKDGKWKIATQRLTRLTVQYHPPASECG